MKIVENDYDKVIRSQYVTAVANYSYAIDKLIPLVNKLDFQRNSLKPNFYKRLEKDILIGCIMPPLTIALISKEENVNINEDFINDNISKAFVLDGIQRLSTLDRIKNHDDLDKNRNIYFNLLICDSMDKLLYRMITLNNGQKPMSARHQIEVLADNIIEFDELQLIAISEKDRGNFDKNSNHISKEVLIKGYLAYISGSVNIDNQKIIESKMDELITEQIIESDLPSRDYEYSDVISFVSHNISEDDLRKWFYIPNNFIGFMAAMAKHFGSIKNIPSDQLLNSINLFEESFDSIDVSKIKLGMARRRMVSYYFNNYNKLSILSPNELLDKISMEI